ncbi:hypothetical protein ACP81J_25200 [Escherichia coli]
MQIKIAAPLGGDAIIEFDDNEEVSGRLSIISGDITEDMISEAIAGANLLVVFRQMLLQPHPDRGFV